MFAKVDLTPEEVPQFLERVFTRLDTPEMRPHRDFWPYILAQAGHALGVPLEELQKCFPEFSC